MKLSWQGALVLYGTLSFTLEMIPQSRLEKGCVTSPYTDTEISQKRNFLTQFEALESRNSLPVQNTQRISPHSVCEVRLYNKVFMHCDHTYSLQCASHLLHKHHFPTTKFHASASD